MELYFLGTSAAVPSKSSSTSCIAVREGRNVVLLDCGEGSQRQLMISPVSFMRIGAILITHLHGDHVFGLPGLIQTMSLSDRREPLLICGPPGIRRFVESAMESTEGTAGYDIEYRELAGGESFVQGPFTISSFHTEHGMSSLGYVLREADRPGRLDHERALSLGIRDGPDMARIKNGETVNGIRPEDVVGPAVPGLSIAYTGDTVPCRSTVEAVRGVDVLIHESTYMESESRNAGEHNHSTSLQAARVALEAGVRCLILTHISHRYENRLLLEEEARTLFPESYVAIDMEMFEITRGKVGHRLIGRA